MALFPEGYERLNYVEPFAGACWVFLTKRPSTMEVLNDRNEELVNFLLTVKYHCKELVRVLRLIPRSRLLYARALDEPVPASSIMRAARFVYLNACSMGGLGRPGGFAVTHSSEQAASYRKLLLFAKRFEPVNLECNEWYNVIANRDGGDTLFYIDPPYLGTTGYSSPFGKADWGHLRAVLAEIKGKFLLSAEGTQVMKVLWRGARLDGKPWRQRTTEITGSLGPNDKVMKELLVWNY